MEEAQTNHLVLERVQKTEGKGPGKFLLSHNEGGLIAPVCCIKLFGTLYRLLPFRKNFVSIISSILQYDNRLVCQEPYQQAFFYNKKTYV